jgi:hypothetical protein
MSHAILSPSSAHRWLTCTRSARDEQKYPDRGSDAAAEGTTAHKLAELRLMQELVADHPEALDSELAEIRQDKWYSQAMEEHVDDYVTFVTERYNSLENPIILLEERIDLTIWVPEGFGTGDVLLVGNGQAELIDLKYGKGVRVEAVQNKQLKLYGLGAITDLSFLYDIDRIRLTIYQPRIGNFSSWETGQDELMAWAKDELMPKAKLAWEGKGDYVPGDHCKFCKAAAVCKANAERHLDLAKYDFAPSNKLAPEEISDIMRRGDAFKAWIKAVEDYALDQALNHDVTWPGFKLVEGRSVRKYLDERMAATKLLTAGALQNQQVYKDPELRGIGEIEKALGKKRFAEILDGLVIKPQGKPTLVENEDKRPAWHSAKDAAKDFSTENDQQHGPTSETNM